MGNKRRSGGPRVSALRSAVRQLAPESTTVGQDIECVMRMCVMGACPEGDEDPKALMSTISDETVERVARTGSKSRDSVIGRVLHFFILEWGLRRGLLKEWAWSWEGPEAGRVSYRPGVPLSKLTELASSG
jgi:hypothetical protein